MAVELRVYLPIPDLGRQFAAYLGRGKGSALAPSLRPRQASACIPPKHPRTQRRNH